MKFWKRLFGAKETQREGCAGNSMTDKDLDRTHAQVAEGTQLSEFDKSRDRKFADFAEKACHSRQSIMISLREGYPLVQALEKALMKSKALDSPTAFRKATDDLRLACAKCGEYSDEARSVVLLGGQGGVVEQGNVIFGGPKVAALGQGRCPGCNGTNVTATFDPSPSGVPELRRAVADSNLALIREIIGRGVDVDASHPDDGATSLAYAAQEGLTGVVEVLLDAGASPNVHDEGGEAIPLSCATVNGHTAAARLLLGAGANANARDCNNLTALHFAAVYGHVDVVAALLEAGADTEAKPTPDGWTPLFYAIEKGHERVVEVLLKGGANPNNSNEDGISPLLYAATKGRQDNIQRLLREAGAKSTLPS